MKKRGKRESNKGRGKKGKENGEKRKRKVDKRIVKNNEKDLEVFKLKVLGKGCKRKIERKRNMEREN